MIENDNPVEMLINRVSLEEQLAQFINTTKQNNQKVAVMYIGLRKISFITNAYNHTIGDRLLKESVDRIQTCLREHDLLFRTSERDFIAVLIYESNVEVVTDIAEAVLQMFHIPFVEDRYEFHIHANIGINTYIGDESDAETVIKDAYIAYRRAKENGKNTFSVSSPDMNIQTYKIFTLQNDLYKAMENGELELYYQPRIDPFTYKIIGAEALLRWNHPTFGIVSPGEFIPLAEESDLILSIGEWVIREACRQNRIWHDAGINKTPISINISGKQLMQKDFVEIVATILQETLEGDWVEFEVTESTVFNKNNEEAVINTIAKLQELGIKIAIDDFGTGYSSLSRLKQFKCKTIKVDQSFVKNIEENSDDMIITESIIQLSHTLGMNIVAEGVETVEQFQFLQGKQCDEVQGYLFSQPIPRNDFETLLRIGACSVLDEHPSGMDRRQSFRVVLPYPLISMMTVLSVQGKAVDIGSTEVLIQDMGPRGLNFLSNLKVPVGPKIVLQFKFNIFQPLQVEGSVIRSVERKQGIYEYGAYFIEDEKFFSILTQLLSQLAVKLRKNPIVPGCGFYTKNKWTFFKKYLVDSRNR